MSISSHGNDSELPIISLNIRQPMNQEEYDEIFIYSQPQKPRNIYFIKQYFSRFYKPFTSLRLFWNSLTSLIPIFQWLPKYSMNNFSHDLIGGLTIGIMHVPQGIAYASLASQDPVIGLYTSLFPVITYMIFGTSRHCSIGSFAIVALMTGNVVSKQSKNFSTSSSFTAIEIASVLTFEIGLIQCLIALLKLDFVCTYLTDDLVAGFTTGASFHVFVTQLKDIFGIYGLPRRDGAGSLFMRIFDLLKNCRQVNLATIGMSAGVFAFLILGRKANAIIQRKINLSIPIPFDLIAVITAIAFSLFLNLETKYGVSTVGIIPTGFPRPRLPKMDLCLSLIPDALSITAVIMAIHISLAKMFSQKYSYPINTNQEFYALGFSSIVSGFFPTFPSACSLARTMVNGNVGTRTQLSSIFSTSFIIVIVLYMGKWLRPLPMCVLGCIILTALLGVFKKFSDLIDIWKISRIDFSVWIVTFLATVLIDVMLGLAISIGFVLLTSVLRQQWPNWHILANMKGTSDYRDSQRYQNVHIIENVCIFRFDSPLMFLNTERFSEILTNLSYKCILQEGNSKRMSLVTSTKSDCTPCFIVIDCSGFVYVDRMGLNTLKDVFLELREKKITVYFAAAKACLLEMFIDSDLHKNIPRSFFFPTVHDAVMTANKQNACIEYFDDCDEADDIQSIRRNL